jgi:hypothetical protein
MTHAQTAERRVRPGRKKKTQGASLPGTSPRISPRRQAVKPGKAALSRLRQTLVYETEGELETLGRDLDAVRALDRQSESRQLQPWVAVWVVGIASAWAWAAGCWLAWLGSSPDNTAAVPVVFLSVAVLYGYGLRWLARRGPTQPPVRRPPWATVLVPAAGVGVAALETAFFLRLDAGAWPWLVVALPGMATTVWCVVLIRRYGRLNLEDRRYALVARLLGVVGRDLGPSARIALHLDLAAADSHGKLVDKEGGFGRSVRRYHDPWLRLAGRLLDGTRFELRWAERLTVKTKSSRRKGTRIWRKVKSRVRLNLTVKPARARQLARLRGKAKGAAQLPAEAKLRTLEVHSEGLAMKVALLGEWHAAAPNDAAADGVDGVEVVVRMFLSLYHLLGLARRLDRRVAGGKEPAPAPALPS